MKPLKIIMEGFGPYLKKTEVDLTKFGNNGLYLITGNTGAGKTTIFDAISYVLFGNPSGENRDNTMLRCIFAHPENPTYVQMEFEFRKKIYKIKRNPEYIGLSKKGDSTKTVKQDAYLENPDSSIICGYEKVTQAVCDLINLNKQQFSQLAMIAQGDFQKVLFTPTKDKQEVYRQIFRTENYKKLTDKLEEKNKEEKFFYEQLRKKSCELFDDIYCDKDDVLSLELEKSKNIQMDFEEQINLINQIIQKDESLLKKLKKELKNKESEKDKITQSITKAETLNSAFEKLSLTKNELNAEKQKFSLIEKEFNIIGDLEKQIKQIDSNAAILKNKMESYSLLYEKSNKLSQLNKSILNNEQEILRLKEVIEKNKADLLNSKNEIEKLSNSDVKLLQIQNLLKELENEYKSINNLNDSLLEEQKLSEQLINAQNLYKKSYEEADLLNEKYRTIKKIFMDNLAGVLAASLKENSPCPVCGSVLHSNPCKVSSEIPSKEIVSNAENEYQKAQAKCDKDNKIACELKIQLDNLSSDIQNKFSNSKLKEKSIQAIATEINKINEQIKENQNKEKIETLNSNRKKQIEKNIPFLEKTLEENNLQITNLQLQNERDISTVTGFQDSINEIKKTLEYESKEIAEKKLFELQNESLEKQNNVNKIRTSYEQSINKINELKGIIKTLEEQTQNFQVLDTKELYKQKEEIESDIKQIELKNSEVNVRFSKNKEKFEKIKETQNEIEVSEKKFSMINSLYKTAAGNLGNKKYKIQIETYVQMKFLDKVIVFANERLKIMTDKQYELIRKKDDLGLHSFSGLDIDVIDHFNGGIRSVKSLSGGESFQASLALALGLSDIVRHSFAGVTIDTLFIDEGFGTLDQDSLQKSFKALLSLTEETERLIGIISHVDYLKDKIKNHVCVTKNENNGSSVQIFT